MPYENLNIKQLKAMVTRACKPKSKIKFLYCDRDQTRKPYLLLSATTSELKHKKLEIKKRSKSATFAQGSVQGDDGLLVFIPKAPHAKLQTHINTVFSRAVPTMKDAVVRSEAAPTQPVEDTSDDDDTSDEDTASAPEQTAPEDEAEQPPPPGMEGQIEALRGVVLKIASGKTGRFLYCPENADGLPELLINKKLDPRDIKRLKTTAKKKKFVRGTASGDDDKRIVFRSKNHAVPIFQKHVTKLFGASIKKLKTALFMPLEDSQEATAEEAIDSAVEDAGERTTIVDASKAVAALNAARADFEGALKAAFQGALAPAGALTPLASAQTVEGGRAEAAIAAFDAATDDNRAERLEDINTRITEYTALLASLNQTLSEYAALRQDWEDRAAERAELEDFVIGRLSSDWDQDNLHLVMTDQQLAAAMDAVRGPLSEAGAQADTGAYTEAARLIDEAWQVYTTAKQRVAAARDQATDFDARRDVQKIRKQLEALASTDMARLTDNLTDDIMDERDLSESDSRALAAHAVGCLSDQRRALAERLEKNRGFVAEYAQKGPEALQAALSSMDDELADLLDAVTALADEIKSVSKGRGSDTMVGLEIERKAQLDGLSGLLDPWQQAADQIAEADTQWRGELATLEDVGVEIVAGFQAKIDALRETHSTLLADNMLATRREQLTAALKQATSLPMLTAVDLKPAGSERDGWVGRAQEWLTALATHWEMLAKLKTEHHKLKELAWGKIRAQINALVARIEGYKKYTEIPESFVASRQALISALDPYINSSNLQTIQHALTVLEGYASDDIKSPFPSVPAAIALFTSATDRDRGWLDREDDNRRAAAALLKQNPPPFNLRPVLMNVASLQKRYGDLIPGLAGALRERADQAKEQAEREGPHAAGLADEVDGLAAEAQGALTAGFALQTALESLAEKLKRADKIVGQMHGNRILSGTFLGPLRTSVDAIRADAPSLQTAALVALLAERAQKLLVETEERWSTLESKGETHLLQEIINQQLAAEAEQANEAEQQKIWKAEWDDLLQQYASTKEAVSFMLSQYGRDDPRRIFEKNEQIQPLISLRENAEKTRGKAPTAEAHKMACTQVKTAIDRMKALAKDPESVQVTAKQDLNTLPKKWAEAVGGYQSGVDALLAVLRGLQVDEDNQPVVSRAIEQVTAARALFSSTAFDAPILTITLSRGTPEQVKTAREQGLVAVRRYREQLNSHPALRALLTNPFAPVPVTSVHKCLGDLDLNLQRCL